MKFLIQMFLILGKIKILINILLENLYNSSPKVEETPRRKSCTEVKVTPFPSMSSTPTNEATASTSSRIFKDITSHYSSESGKFSYLFSVNFKPSMVTITLFYF